MKVLWISDFGISHSIGGAQRSNQIVIDEGRSRDYLVTEFNHSTDKNVLKDSYDLVVSSNLEILSSKYSDIIEYISSANKHVRLEHDANRYLSQENREILFGSCDISFFLTQFHYDKFVGMYGSIFKNVEVIPDPIDTKMFYNMENEREDKILYVGYMHYLKGTSVFLEYVAENPNLQFVMACWGSTNYQQVARSLSNIEWLGSVDYSKMPNLYNKYKILYYHPIFFEPFCRSVGEALLCGMEINSNNIVGSLHHYSAMGEEQFKSTCGNAASLFWNHVEAIL